MHTNDDAGVLRLDAETALVMTVDFFTPIVDDPYNFGAIAAANALSDVYAMGGEPLAALNCAGFPPGEDQDLLRAILQGGADKVAEAGAVVAGGHSIRDDELKFGLAVVGRVHPERVVTNANARPGDRLVLTKPIGTGLLSTARRRDEISEDEFTPAVVSMLALNKDAAAAMMETGVNACTDVSGFGLFGHGQEMACAGKVALAFNLAAVPLLPGARMAAERGFIPGGARNNLAHFEPFLEGVFPDPAWWAIAFDPQTSGGLLISVPAERLQNLVAGLARRQVLAAVVGEVLAGPQGKIVIRP